MKVKFVQPDGDFEKSAGVRLKKWLLHDLGRKIAALILAGLLFWNYAKKDDVLDTYTVPVKLDLPAGVVCLNAPEALQVSLTIAGNKDLLEVFDPAALCLRGKITSRHTEAGRNCKLRLFAKNVEGLDRHFKVKEIAPRELNLILEKVSSKDVPVLPRFDSESALSQDYRIDHVNFVPDKVTISGPEHLLASVQEIYTFPIPIDGRITESFDYRIGLRVPDGVQSARAQVDAQVEIVKAFAERIFTSVPLFAVQSAEHTRKFKVGKINPDTVTVELRGPKEIMVNLPSEEITAIVNINAVKNAGVFEIPVNPMLEKQYPGVTVRSIQPAVAEVTVENE